MGKIEEYEGMFEPLPGKALKERLFVEEVEKEEVQPLSAKKELREVIAIHLAAVRLEREACAALVENLAESFEAERRIDYRFCSYEAIVQLVALADQIRDRS